MSLQSKAFAEYGRTHARARMGSSGDRDRDGAMVAFVEQRESRG